MRIQLAVSKDKLKIEKYDKHIPSERLSKAISEKFVYVLKDEHEIVGILRYSLFWQTIPFLDLIYIDKNYRGSGYGRQMMGYWENEMRQQNYSYALISTQEDESAWEFYEKLNYKLVGAFFPPEQEVKELIYSKDLTIEIL